MGLDMYIYKRNGENDDVELAYFRKFNALHYYILELTGTHMDSNCEEIDLTLDQLNNVLLTLKNVESILKNGKLDEDGIEQIQYVIHEVERGAEVYY